MANIIHYNGSGFTDILSKHDVVIVDFFAEWCAPCRALQPIFEQLSTGYPTIHFLKINIDSFPEFTEKYEISSIPRILLFKNKELVSTLIGILPKKRYKTEIERLL